MENEHLIVSALQKGVVAAVAASNNPALPVKYLLVGWAGVPQDQKWLEIVWIPNNRVGDFWGEEMNHRGILRLILHWPDDGGGIYAPIDLLASITAYFTKGMLLSNVEISAKPNPTGVFQDAGEVLFPVSIYYQSYRKGA